MIEKRIGKEKGNMKTYLVVALATKDGVNFGLVVGREGEELGGDERRLGLASGLELDVGLKVASQNRSAEVRVDGGDQVVHAAVLGEELLVEVSPGVVEKVQLVARGLDRGTRGEEAEELGSKVDLGLAGGLVGSAGSGLLLLLDLEDVGSLGRSSKRSLELLAENIGDDPGVERLRRDRNLNLDSRGGGDGQSSKERTVAVAVSTALAGELDVGVIGRCVLDARHDV